MESPYFERSRYRTDYHCKVLLYSALQSHEIHPILKQLARQSVTDERLLSRDNMGCSSPLKYDSRDSQLPNPIPIVVPLTEPTKKEESNLANLNIKVHVKNRQISRQELIIDAAFEFHANSLVDFVILLFDLSDRSSFEALDSLFQEFMKDHSAVNLAEPSRILAVGKVQSQEIHQLVFRDEIDLWCSRQKESPNLSFTYFEYSMVYSQGAHDLLALITEPFQTKYTTQLSRGKSLESPTSNRNSVGTGFFHSSFAQGKEKINDGNFGTNGFSLFDNSKVPRSDSSDQQRQRSISAPLYEYHGQDGISKSDLIEMEEEKKRYERQRKWQDMEFQMRLMLETDQLEEDRLAELEEQERLQQQQQQQQNLESELSTSVPASPVNQQQQKPTSSTIMSNAIGFFRNIPPLSPSSQQSKNNVSTNFSTAPSSSLSLHPPIPTVSHLSTTSSSSGLSPQPPPPPGCSPSSPSVATHKEFFVHSGNSKLPSSGISNSSLKSRSEDTYDCHPNTTQPASKQTKTPTVHGLPTDLRLRPVSTSTLRLPPLPSNTPPSNNNVPHLTINTNVTNNNNGQTHSSANSGVSSPASALIPPSVSTTNGNASNNNIVVAVSSSSSSISIMQSVLKRTGSMFSQASQRTSSQISLRSRLSSRNTMNSNSRASSCLDLQTPSVDDINVLIETMHTAVKSEQELFQRTMYLYGASGSDLLLLSSEDEDDKYGEESDEEKSSGANSSRHEKGFYGNHSQPSSNPSQTIPKSPKNISPKPRSPHPVHNNSRANVSSHSSNMHTNANSSTHNSSSSGPYRSYISDLSTTSSRYTQSSLEERGLIDPERLSHWMTGSTYNNHHLTSSANNSPPFPGLNHSSQKNQEDLVVASLLSGGNSGQVGHSSQDKEEEDRILDIIVGLSPSTDMMSSPPSSSRKRLSSRTSKRRSKEDKHNDMEENSDVLRTNSRKAREVENDNDLVPSELVKPAQPEEIPSTSHRRTESVFIIGCGCM